MAWEGDREQASGDRVNEIPNGWAFKKPLRGLHERQVPYMCAVKSTFGFRLPEEVAEIKPDDKKSQELIPEINILNI